MKILGSTQVTLEQARSWATLKGAHQRAIAVAWHYWGVAPRYNIPAEVAFCQAMHETNWGKYTGVVPSTFHNWCGLKTKQGGSNDSASAHQTFENDATGVLAHIQHLARYAGLQTLPDGDVLVDPRWGKVTQFTDTVEGLGGKDSWAPHPDYGKGLVKIVNDLRLYAASGGGGTPMVLQPPAGWTPPQIVRRVLPRDASNTPQRTMDWQYITVHNTGNPKPTADALMHASWLESLAKAGKDEPSWQYTVDDTRVVQHLEDDQAGWHASDNDGPGNLASLGFELVEIGNQERVLWNAGWAIAQKLKSKGKDTSVIRQHHDWARDKKNCPRLLRANNGAGWTKLLAIITHFLKGPPAPEQPPEWHLHLGGGVMAEYPFVLGFRSHVMAQAQTRFPTDPNSAALAMFGEPKEHEWEAVNGHTYQRCKRLTLHYIPGNPAPWDVIHEPSGSRLPDRKTP